jgi:TetR/AcrR family transcriptional repressor of bet genes
LSAAEPETDRSGATAVAPVPVVEDRRAGFTPAARAPVVEDPRASLTPAAREILAAAQRVLLDKGFGGLTLRAVARESGANSAMVQYYFGSKDGLVEAMIDSVFRDDQEEAASIMAATPREERVARFVDGLRTIGSSRSFRVFFDILPYALRIDRLRARMARVYEWYRRLKRDWLPSEDASSPAEEEVLLAVAELATAVVDGLAVQELIDDSVDRERAYAVLEFMLRRSLPDLLESGLPAVAAKR